MITPTYTQGPAILWRIQTDPTFNADTGALEACVITAFFKAKYTNDANPADTYERDLGSVPLDCVGDASRSVTFIFNGESFTVPLGVGATCIAQAAKDAWYAQP